MSEEGAALKAQSTSPAPAKAGVGCFKRLRSHRNVLLASTVLSTGAFVVQTQESSLEVAAAHASAESAAGLLYRDGPPAGFSGGFGEDHCQACHAGDKLNASPGRLTILAPQRYSSGETYAVTITLTRPGMAIGGFQFTARFEEGGAQAGTLALAGGQQDRIKVLTDRDVQYAYHLRPGTQPTATDVVRWTLHWTAPAGRRPVLFHAAANAANGDDSQAGDFIYLARVRSRGR